MAEIVELHAARNEVWDALSDKLSMRFASLLAAAIVQDEPLRTDLLLAEIDTVAKVVGLTQARSMMIDVWSSQVGQVECLISDTLRDLREAGVLSDPRFCEQ